MITEFGGAVAVPNAVRSSDSTTTIRVNDVIMIRIGGAIGASAGRRRAASSRCAISGRFWSALDCGGGGAGGGGGGAAARSGARIGGGGFGSSLGRCGRGIMGSVRSVRVRRGGIGSG